MPLFRCIFPSGEIAETSLASAGRESAKPGPVARASSRGLLEAPSRANALHYAAAWCRARTGQLDALLRHGLKFRREGRFHVLYRPAGPLFDPADWTASAPNTTLSLDQIRAAKEHFIAAHRKDDRSPFETMAAAQAEKLGLEFDSYDAAVWAIAVRDAQIGTAAYGPMPTAISIIPLALATVSTTAPGAVIPAGLSLAHSAD